MKITAALTREQGQDFVILAVQDRVLDSASSTERDELLEFAESSFGVPAALLGERAGKTYGDPNIVDWLTSIAPEQLPWKEYSLN